MQRDRLLQLLIGRLNGDLSPGEEIEFEAWLAGGDGYRHWVDGITNEAGLVKEVDVWKKIDPVIGYTRWLDSRKPTGKFRISWLIRGVAAAALLAAAVVGFNRLRKIWSVPPPATMKSRPILPGRNTATLVLADGRRILLDSLGNGEVGIQGNSELVKTDSGTVSYKAVRRDRMAVVYNDLTTPKAGQYQLILPDHSHVWLNNLSGIRFPTSFRGPDREVEMSGKHILRSPMTRESHLW